MVGDLKFQLKGPSSDRFVGSGEGREKERERESALDAQLLQEENN